MPPPDPPTSITLKIKVPPGYLTPTTTSELFTLGSIPVNTTIGALRQQIQQNIPSNPAPERQRILYGGRALVDNEQTIADALNTKRDPEQTEYVVHLLVKAEGGAGSGRSTPSGVPQGRVGGIGVAPAVPREGLAVQQPQQGQAGTANGGGPDPMQQHLQQHLRAHGAMHQHPPQHPHQPRPGGQGFHLEGVGPDGQRFQIHQQTMHFPGPPMHMPGQLPMGLPMVPGPNGPVPLQLPAGFGPPPGFIQGGMPPPPPMNWPQVPARPSADQVTHPAQGVTSALDRARENVAEMRRMLDEIANLNNTTDEERRRRVEEVQRRVTSVNNYIDPFNLASAPANAAVTGNAEGRRSAPPRPTDQQGVAQYGLLQPTAQPTRTAPTNLPPPGFARVQVPGMPPQQVQLPSNPDDVSVYLLSSPQGPQALLFSPQHGTHIGSLPANQPPQFAGWQQQQQRSYPLHRPMAPNTASQAPPTAAAAAAEPPDPVAQAAAHLGDVQAQAAAHAANRRDANGNLQDPLGMQPILNHFWMLVRILIFSYFLLGSNLGWQRPVIMLGIGLGFWVVRAGLLGDEGRVRRWWDGVVGVGAQGGQQQQARGNAGQRNDAAPAPAAVPQAQPQANDPNPTLHRRNNPMPTPAQVAQRILNEQEARRNGGNGGGGGERQHWLREQLRPVERALALFVASLWPGIGEAHVREQRRLREEREQQREQQEEEERRRNILREEARRQRAEMERERVGEKGGGGAGEGVENAGDVAGAAEGGENSTAGSDGT